MELKERVSEIQSMRNSDKSYKQILIIPNQVS